MRFANPDYRVIGHKIILPEERIDFLYGVLQYRLAAQEQADELVRIMGLEMPNIFDYAVENYKKSLEEREIYSKVWDLFLKKRLLIKPFNGGLWYSKPLAFICIAFICSRLEWKQIVERVEIAENYVRQTSDQIYSLHGGDAIVNDGEVVRKRDEFMRHMGNLGHRVRQRLPHRWR